MVPVGGGGGHSFHNVTALEFTNVRPFPFRVLQFLNAHLCSISNINTELDRRPASFIAAPGNGQLGKREREGETLKSGEEQKEERNTLPFSVVFCGHV